MDNVWIIKQHYTVLDSDSSYEDSLGTLVLVILPTNDYHCVRGYLYCSAAMSWLW